MTETTTTPNLEPTVKQVSPTKLINMWVEKPNDWRETVITNISGTTNYRVDIWSNVVRPTDSGSFFATSPKITKSYFLAVINGEIVDKTVERKVTKENFWK